MRKKAGFTLIEMMIVVAIVAILAAIALPAYQDYVRRGRISEAVGMLSAQSARMEQFFQDNRTYVGSCAGTTGVAPAMAPTAMFTFACSGQSPSAFLLTATGNLAMQGFTYTIDQSGARATPDVPTGWTANNTCWVIRKDGTC